MTAGAYSGWPPARGCTAQLALLASRPVPQQAAPDWPPASALVTPWPTGKSVSSNPRLSRLLLALTNLYLLPCQPARRHDLTWQLHDPVLTLSTGLASLLHCLLTCDTTPLGGTCASAGACTCPQAGAQSDTPCRAEAGSEMGAVLVALACSALCKWSSSKTIVTAPSQHCCELSSARDKTVRLALGTKCGGQ